MLPALPIKLRSFSRVAKTARVAHPVTLRADLTRPDQRLQRYRRHFGGACLPYAVILGGGKQVSQTLPGLFIADTLVSAIHGAPS